MMKIRLFVRVGDIVLAGFEYIIFRIYFFFFLFFYVPVVHGGIDIITV